MSATNRALSRTALIFCGLRTMRLSLASPSQNSSGSKMSRLGSKRWKAASKPGHFCSITLHTKPAENTRLAISASTRSSPILASAFGEATLGRRLARAFSPPLRLAARARIALNDAIASPARGQAVQAAQHEGLPPVRMLGIVEPQRREAPQQGGDRYLALDAGELRAEAEVDAAAERQRPDVGPGNVESVGIGIDG